MTRPLQLRRSWGPSVFGPLQLLQLAAIFAVHCGKLAVYAVCLLLVSGPGFVNSGGQLNKKLFT